jgi:exoribonuclease-2
LRWEEVDLTIEARLLDITQDASGTVAAELDEEMAEDSAETELPVNESEPLDVPTPEPASTVVPE